MNIKKAVVTGVLQDWDINDNRFDIERVSIEVPLFLLDAFSAEEVTHMVGRGYYGCGEDDPLGLLVGDLIEGGFFSPSAEWELEDPCELKLEVEYEEEA